MGDEPTHRWIFDRSYPNDIQFAVRRERNANNTVDPIPLRERTALNVVSHRLCRLVNRVRSEIADLLSNWSPRTVGRRFCTVSSDDLDGHMATAIEYGHPFDARTPRIVLLPSCVWSYTESNNQVPTMSSLSVFCWPTASLAGRTIPRHRTAKVVIVSVVNGFIFLLRGRIGCFSRLCGPAASRDRFGWQVSLT
jgi:hypothetical protein